MRGGELMNEQQEYGIFQMKCNKHLIEMERDFNNLSENNKIRFANEVQLLLQTFNIFVGIEQVIYLLEQRHFG